MTKKIALWIIALSVIIAFAGEKKNEIKWQTLQDGMNLAKKENKPLYVFIFSSHCGWCRKFKQNTLSNSDIINTLSEKFISAKLNTSSNQKQEFNGKKATQRQLASMFGIRGVPTSVFMDSEGKVITKIPGYAPPETFGNILRYIGEGWYNDMSYQEFIESENLLKNK